MAGITQGRPELAVGEPIRLGNDNDFEIEQHPVSDRLIIRDTQNGKVAYVRKERGGSIGGDGVLIKALKEGKPMADDGRTHDTIQQAERAADGWVFVPPGTYNESVEITTDNLTLRGSGYNTVINGGTDNAITVSSSDVTVEHLSAESDDGTSGSGTRGVRADGDNCSVNTVSVNNVEYGIEILGASGVVQNCNVSSTNDFAIRLKGEYSIAHNCSIDGGKHSVEIFGGADKLISNCVAQNASSISVYMDNTDNNITIGNRVINAGDMGIRLNTGADNIIANNRVSDSTNTDISDAGTGTVLDGNLTGASN